MAGEPWQAGEKVAEGATVRLRGQGADYIVSSFAEKREDNAFCKLQVKTQENLCIQKLWWFRCAKS